MARPEQRIHCVTVKCGGHVDAGHGARTMLHVIDHAGRWECSGTWLLAVIVTSLGEQLVEAWSAGSSGSSLANGAKGLLLRVTCCCTNRVVQMRTREVIVIEVGAFCGYKAAGAGLLLTVERNTLVSGEGVTIAGGTLGSSAAPTLGAVMLGGRVELMMAFRLRIAVLRWAALMAVVGMVLCNVRRTSHATRTVRMAGCMVRVD
jgi:hypothetical protein